MRLLTAADAPALAAACVRNREHLDPWEPLRAEEYFTEQWQAADLTRRFIEHESGEAYAWGLFSDDLLIGRFNLAGVVRGPFQSAWLGYWVDHAWTGRGLASAAVQVVIDAARDTLGLHRIEACTLLHNAASQRVLAKSGFRCIGTAPQYLQIAGRWQDHHLFQVVLHD